MYIFPEIPNEILVQDFLKGVRNQSFSDASGKHQYQKRLDRVRAMQSRSAILKNDYYKKKPNGSKVIKYVNHFLLKEFGAVLEIESIYCEFEDKFDREESTAKL